MAADFATLADASAWFCAWLAEGALPLWADAGVDRTGAGLFQDLLSVDGAPVDAPRRARTQARQAFVFATAANEGFGARWLEAARAGHGRFKAVYTRPDGLFRRRCAGDGTPIDETADVYDQAFAMLAMAALHAAHPAGGFLDEADRALAALQARRAPAGGFEESPPHLFQANCHMHLFETALAWEEAGGGPEWRGLADEIAGLALNRFIDPADGALREFFEADWSRIEGAGGLIEPGHQFEWAWLLERWGRARESRAALEAAKTLYANGLKGIDAARNVAVGAMWEDFSVRDPVARLWPQTERLKAALALGSEAQALSAAAGLAQYLQTPARGAWRDKLQADGTFVEEPAPATSFYHLMVAILELKARAGR